MRLSIRGRGIDTHKGCPYGATRVGTGLVPVRRLDAHREFPNGSIGTPTRGVPTERTYQPMAQPSFRGSLPPCNTPVAGSIMIAW
jgi:hypothetical protein